MNCLVWNARGLGIPHAFREFRRLLADTSPSLAFVCETRAVYHKCQWWKDVLGYEGFFMVNAVGQKGGLLLLWRAPVNVDVFSYSAGHVDCGVTFKYLRWRFTCFYGNPNPSLRTASWMLLRRLASLHKFASMPWLVGGDFNEINCSAEKVGRRMRDFGRIDLFRSALDDCGLEDNFWKNTAFMWTNKRKGDDIICARLDRFVMNRGWTNLLVPSKVQTIDEYGSDHRALLLKMVETAPTSSGGGRRRFHFEQKWFFDQNFVSDFVMEWKQMGGEALHQRLNHSQAFLSRWAGSRFDKLRKQISELRKERVKLLNQQGFTDISGQLTRLTSRLVELTNQDEVHWRQRSRVNWLAHGDRNTKYFHNHASMRKKRNTIYSMKNDIGEIVTKDSEIATLVQVYFLKLFTTEHPRKECLEEVAAIVDKRVPEHLKNIFDVPFTASEIKKALFQMHPTKAPGPDGFQAVFFQKLWGAVGVDMTGECLKILSDGGDIVNWNNTNICLIPKVAHPELVQNFRPISLCNTSYKVVAKAIVNRLRIWLPHLIDDTQSAFVPAFNSDNILVGFECMNWIRGQKKSMDAYVAAKLDMSKAYDHVEWTFLRLMMITLGFPTKLVDLIMQCVTLISYSFVVNGKVYGEIKPTRGIRQGDPLSPFLFVICSQGLASIFHAYVTRQLFYGIRIARRAPMVSHLFFVEDSLVFFKASRGAAARVVKALDLYSHASGQLINYEKSALTFNPGARQEVKDGVKRIFGVNVVQSHSVYLELPIFMMRSHRLQFQYLTKRISKRLSGWINKSFSAGGKEVLIKSVIQSIPTYTMACFKIPTSVNNDIERLCAKFWWGDKEAERKMHWTT